MPKQFTLGKNERLKSRKQIEQLFSNGKKFVVAPFRIFYQVDSKWSTGKEKNALQFGIGVSAKNFKKAVDRNKIKRLTREAWRLQKNNLKKKLISAELQLNVFFVYTARNVPAFDDIKGKVALVLEKLFEKINENNSSNT